MFRIIAKKALSLLLALIETVSFLSRFFIGIKRFSEEQDPYNLKKPNVPAPKY
jgi:hypothetical protein